MTQAANTHSEYVILIANQRRTSGEGGWGVQPPEILKF
jgi:hypothetical protein